METSNSDLQAHFSPDELRKKGRFLVDLLADHLEKSLSGDTSAVLPNFSPDEMLSRFSGDFKEGAGEDFEALMKRALYDSINLQNPRYIGHQCCTPLPMAALSELLGAYINNGSAVYEMGPVNIAMEKRLVQWMAGLIGYDEEADGIFTHGGTLGNLTALLAARQSKSGYDIWTHGADNNRPLSILVSTQSHYSIRRAVSVMGLGEDAVTMVDVDSDFKMDTADLNRKHAQAVKNGRKVIAIVGNACTTPTGAYDDLNMVADFAEKNGLWFHVDGAHGASALISKKYRGLLDGIHRADSMVWDAHKMLMIPALATAVIFKNKDHSFEAFSQKASYLFEKDPHEEWYNYAHRTMECTKTMMGIKLYAPLAVYGTDLFADFIDRSYDLTREFAEAIKNAKDFELAAEPEANIICFRYLAPNVSDLSDRQNKIRRKILEGEKYYIVKTELNNSYYLRCTIINPNTTMKDLKGLLDHIRRQ